MAETKIQNFHVPARADKNICRLDVAVNNSAGMRCIQRVGNLDAEIEQLIELQRTALDAVLEGLALQQLHGDKVLAIGDVNFMDGADVWIIQRRGGPRLALEAFDSLRIAGKFRWEEFQCDKAPQLEVFGLVNHAHAAAAQLFHDSVMGDGASNHAGSPESSATMLGVDQAPSQSASCPTLPETGLRSPAVEHRDGWGSLFSCDAKRDQPPRSRPRVCQPTV